MYLITDLLAVTESIGGPVVAILLLLSAGALSIVIARLTYSLRLASSARYPADALIRALHKSPHFPEKLISSQSPRIANIRDAWEAQKLPDPAQARTEALRVLRNRMQAMSFGLRPLEVIATVSPLLGLFGTVLGMIEAFQAMEAAGSQVDPAVLSGGIWGALLTTAVGLGVAIPVTLIHSWFERRQENLGLHLLSDTEQVLTIRVRPSATGNATANEHTVRALSA
ncbi:MAG: MotA/TolQ/ExbB proton channel family protein [Thalassolituus sp.]